tara:strand:- start:3208 stop:3777 length:570 start_codon:yes stop_codon:yes gene_type:complete
VETVTNKKIIFLDRDGTLNPDPGYINSLDQFEFYKNIFNPLQTLAENGYKFIIATNQSGVARGIIPIESLNEIHQFIRDTFKQKNVPLLGIYYCPHHPGEGCNCRKPRWGLVESALADIEISLSDSWLIGDSMCDVEMGIASGIPALLVRTGNGIKTEAALEYGNKPVEFIGDTLNDCAEFILNREWSK